MDNGTKNDSTDAKLTAAKFTVLILSVLIFAVGITIFFKAINMEKKEKHTEKLNRGIQKHLNLTGVHIKDSTVCDKYLCLITEDNTNNEQVIIINPANTDDIKIINLN